MNRRRWLRYAAGWMAAAILAGGAAGYAETAPTPSPVRPSSEVFLPTPEPPPPASTNRPTPAPTEPPDSPVIDHINRPNYYADFSFPENAKILDIWIPNIKDADAAILQFDGQVYMIDCGDEKAAVRTQLMLSQLGIEKIDVLFNSHPHHDHIDGLQKTYEMAKINMLKICFSPTSTESGQRMLKTAARLKIPVSMYQDGDAFTMGKGEVTLQFLVGSGIMLTMNNKSATTIVRYGERSILFTADIEKDGQQDLMERIDPSILKCDILKYPHHGKHALYEPFYNAVDAKLYVVTSEQGRRQDSGQTFLSYRQLPTVYTSVYGTFVHLATDGKYWLCERVPLTVQ